MENSEIDAIIASLFRQAFDVSADEINDETRRGDLDRWDSLGHLDLLELLRQRFEIDIAPELALEMETVADVKRIVADIKNNGGA